jgi:DNA-binding response OmpR family regulator
MARILHLEDDLAITKRLSAILRQDGHIVTTHTALEDAQIDRGVYDLYICGTLGRYSDGLSFALKKKEAGETVLILANRRKFSRLPFINTSSLIHGSLVVQSRIREILAGG